MTETLIQRIARDASFVRIDPSWTYIRSYREFIRYFADLPEITEHNLIIAANFAYGWMPTSLNFKSAQFTEAVILLNRAKAGSLLTDEELWCLIHLINNSMVGVSKVLHFINPKLYAIWDSRVDSYLRGYPYWPPSYLAYLALCRDTVKQLGFSPVHMAINQQVGYPVSPLRALELVMYQIGRGAALG